MPRKPVLFKVPGVHKVRLGPLIAFINSDENYPKSLVNSPDRDERRYVTLLNADVAQGEQDKPDPLYNLSLRIVTEYGGEGASDVVGGATGPTPRLIMEKIF